jgi:hypothetical protein
MEVRESGKEKRRTVYGGILVAGGRVNEGD